jgi:glycosyltransferase involved in cell wall biosynthesis
MKSLVAFSHLRWDSVPRRPQQLLSRLAGRWRVIFIEEPQPNSDCSKLVVADAAQNVQVWRPYVTGAARGFHDDHLPVLRRLLADAVQDHQVRDFWIWLCTPMALPLASALSPRGLVYDCMQELFSGHAPAQLVQRENAVFKMADLVFAGGRSIYNAKRYRHPEVHCLPSSVDARHFQGPHGEHPLQAGIPHPRLGYCGVIDERINLELVEGIAKRRPEWNIVMVGPTEGIDAGALPRRDNIHWLGRRDYDELPALISGWDLGLMPYSLDESTRFISPDQTLEYMACGCPVVSTSIRDVVESYGQVVRIADTPEGFIADAEMILQRTAREREEHTLALAEIVARTSWDNTANAIADLIAHADDLVDSSPAFTQGSTVSPAGPRLTPAEDGHVSAA